MTTRLDALNEAVSVAHDFLQDEKVGACIVDHLYQNPNISIKKLLEEVNDCEGRRLHEKQIRGLMMELGSYGILTNYTNGKFVLGKIGKQLKRSPDFNLLHAAS